MSKNKDHLFDDLIEALEAMSSDAADPAKATAAASTPDAVPSPQAAPLPQATPVPEAAKAATPHLAHKTTPASAVPFLPTPLQIMTEKARAHIADLWHRLLPLADVRMVVRMSVLLVIAGAVTLFFVTRPYTSGPADARNSTDPAALVAKTHTELERVVIRDMDDPSWKMKPARSSAEPARTEPQETAPSRDEPRRVQTQEIKLERPDLIASLGEATKPADTPEGARAPVVSPPREEPSAASPEPKDITPDMEAAYRRGLDLLGRKDVAAARLMLKRAADRGHGSAALALAETHDASRNPGSAGAGIFMDEAVARKYYTLAQNLGLPEARERLVALDGAAR